jgi:hypothetical protein
MRRRFAQLADGFQTDPAKVCGLTVGMPRSYVSQHRLRRNRLANHGYRAYSQGRGLLSLPEGVFLTNDELKASYVVIRHNVRTYESAGVVEVVKGRTNAESTLKKFESEQSSGDRHEGWRYFLEKTSLKAGTDPAEATELRQAELESRESKATQEGGGSNSGGGLSR